MTLAPSAAPRIGQPLFRVSLTDQLTSGGAAIDEVVALSRTKTGMDGVPLQQQPRIQALIG